MPESEGDNQEVLFVPGFVGRIPVRNLWLLMFYASALYRDLGHSHVAVEDVPEDIPDLVAEILVHAVGRRLKRNLTYGYQTQERDLSRVRARIDLLRTERRQLLSRGRVACRFESLTADTTRNRYVRSALESVAYLVQRPGLAHRCRELAGNLRRLGVVGERPTRAAALADRFGRHDAADRQMVAAAHLAFDLSLPTELAGNHALVAPEREEVWVRRLFEKAVAGFYEVALSDLGWRVQGNKTLRWQVERKTAGMDDILPNMHADIILEHPARGERLVIDTKFTSVLKPGKYQRKSLKSGYLYQLYAYLRTQERPDDLLSLRAAGLLLHPSVGTDLDEAVVIQGHTMRFATVDLCASVADIRQRLLQVVEKAL